MQLFLSALLFLCLAMANTISYAAQPTPWQLGLQEAASPVMENLAGFHDALLILIVVITIIVLGILTYVCWRFRAKNNPKASKTSHNTLLEIIWTTIPILIVVAIIIPSLRHLEFVNKIADAQMTLKVVGYQWYWGYEYPEHKISFDSNLKAKEDLKKGEPYLLETDNRVVLPVDTNIRIQMTGADVIHAWGIPALGVKKDAIPGRLNETWVRIDKPGVYYGQCYELCGINHGYMPITVEAVSKREFARWVKRAKKKFAINRTHQIASIKQSN